MTKYKETDIIDTMQLPLITIDNVNDSINEVLKDIHSWRKEMVHYIKDENPVLNTAIIELSQKAELDAKALAAGAYMAYKLLENELSENDEEEFDNIEDE